MVLLNSLIMMSAGALCLSGAVISRSALALVSSGAMLLSMLDLRFLGIAHPLIWAALFLVLSLCCAVNLRLSAPELRAARRTRALHSPGAKSNTTIAGLNVPLGRSLAILSALAFPFMALQVLMSGAKHAPDAPVATHSSHAGHQFDASAFGIAFAISVAVLVVLLATVGIAALLRRRSMLVLESAGMALMLATMQLH
ncbi:hypothetical protein [Leucobacter sp. USHLN153]|uniref:hypothetical protein n=1 Tax=Leucobacter sp. USHLN153 TaxID=3081268 RepID=UPI00301B4C96